MEETVGREQTPWSTECCEQLVGCHATRGMLGRSLDLEEELIFNYVLFGRIAAAAAAALVVVLLFSRVLYLYLQRLRA